MTDAESTALTNALNVLSDKMQGSDFAGCAKFDMEGLASILIDASGARVANGDADVTLIADPAVFQDILAGDLNPASAFMSGRLKIEGDMGVAMQLAQVLSR